MLDLLQARARAALELVPGEAPDDEAGCRSVLAHAWHLLHAAYGISLEKDFYSVHKAGDVLNCLLLTTSEADARAVAGWWTGYPVTVSTVSAAEAVPERWVAMGVALHWVPPPK